MVVEKNTMLANGTAVLEFIIDEAYPTGSGVITVASTPIDGDLKTKDYSAFELCQLFQNTSYPLVKVDGTQIPTVV